MNAMDKYFDNLAGTLSRVRDTQFDAMEKAARAAYESLKNGGMLYTFGTGHAHILAEEIFYRAGGIVRVYPILDDRLMLHVSAADSTEYERQPGLAEALLKHYPVKKGDVLFVFSNSGRNCAPVEMALAAKKAGVLVVAVTNLRHSQSASPRNPYGLRLFEAADIVIDNMGCVGDAAIEVGAGRKVGPTSTAVGAAIMQAIVCETVSLAVEGGVSIDVFSSSNVDGGDQINEALIAKGRETIKCL